jgi:hypothetical protein
MHVLPLGANLVWLRLGSEDSKFWANVMSLVDLQVLDIRIALASKYLQSGLLVRSFDYLERICDGRQGCFM